MRKAFIRLLACWLAGPAFAGNLPQAITPPATIQGIGGQALNGAVQALCKGGAFDDTAAVAAAFTSARTSGKTVLLPAGTCNVCPTTGGAAETLTTSGWTVSGYGDASVVNLTCDGEFIRNDMSGGVSFFLDTYSNFRTISSLGNGNQTHTAAIRFYCNIPGDPSCGGDNTVTYNNLSFGGIYFGIHYDDPSHTTFNGISQLANYSNNYFNSLHSTAVGGVFPYDVVHFDAGTGPQAIFNVGTYAAIHAGLAAGDGVSGEGDLIAHGIEFVQGQYGFYIQGPTDPTRYAYNVNLTGNQYDGLSVATGYLSNFTGCYLDDNNATVSVAYMLPGTNCQHFSDQFAYRSQNGIQTLNYPSGTNTKTLFNIIRVPGATVAAFDAVEVKVFVSGLIGSEGNIEAVGDYLVEFTNTTTATNRTVSETITGNSLAIPFISFTRVNVSPDHVVFQATLTGAPSTTTLHIQVEVIGTVGRFSATYP